MRDEPEGRLSCCPRADAAPGVRRQESRLSQSAARKPPLPSGGKKAASPSRRSHSGFTLLEVLVAVSILGLGVAVTMQTSREA